MALGTPGTWGMWYGIAGPKLPDFGFTEAAGLGKGSNWQNPLIPIAHAAEPEPDPLKSVVLDTSTGKPTTSFGDLNARYPSDGQTTTGGNQGGGGGDTELQKFQKMLRDTGSLDPAQKSRYEELLRGSQGAQEEAARAAAEGRRRAAQSKYQAQVGIAGRAKERAKGAYDWLIDTIGSNQKDLLTQVALNEEEGLGNLGMQEKKTTQKYDEAKKEIASIYRDLNLQQEKLLRGSGQGQSSRAVEAQMRLNNLLGKDLSTVTTNEADAIGLIGNAVTSLKNKSIATRESIEREGKGKLDKAALDYKAQTDSIDDNLDLSEAEREDAYAEAEAQLKADVAKITTWAEETKIRWVETEKQLNAQLQMYILSMTDDKQLLGSSLAEKGAATDDFVSSVNAKSRLLPQEELNQPTYGVYQKTLAKYKTKDELDRAYQGGEIDEPTYQRQLANLQKSLATGGVRTLSDTAGSTVRRGFVDPLLQAIA